MPGPVTDLKNIGPAMAEALARAGITTAQQLRDLGADAAYARMMATGHKPHVIAFTALALGLQGRPWNDASPAEKADFKARLAHLKSGGAGSLPSGIEAALDRIGTGIRR